VQAIRVLPDFEHVFTHFRLQIFPVIAEGSRWLPAVSEPRYMVARPEQADAPALPAPVKNLLTELVRENTPG
jgi:adenine-specific DNA glycosylase